MPGSGNAKCQRTGNQLCISDTPTSGSKYSQHKDLLVTVTNMTTLSCLPRSMLVLTIPSLVLPLLSMVTRILWCFLLAGTSCACMLSLSAPATWTA